MERISNRPIQHGYIGVTNNIDERWNKHVEESETKFDTLHDALWENQCILDVLLEEERPLYSGTEGYRCVVMYSGGNGYEAYELEEILIEKHRLTELGLNTYKSGSGSNPDILGEPHVVYYIYKPTVSESL